MPARGGSRMPTPFRIPLVDGKLALGGADKIRGEQQRMGNVDKERGGS